jgi:diguanylate cyclase
VHRLRTRPHLPYVAFSVVVALLYLLLPATPLVKIVLYNGVGASAVVAVLLGVRLHRPSQRLPWFLFAAGQASFLTADLIYYLGERSLGDAMPFPGPADLFYLAMYPLVMAGLVLLTRRMLPGRDLASVIDAGVIAIAVFVLSWLLIMDTYIVDEGLSLPARLISLAYPVMDVLLVAVSVRLVAVARTRAPSFYLIGASVLCLLSADTLYALAQLSGGYSTGGPVDTGWLLFYLLFGAAALHPSMSTLSTRNDKPPVLTRNRIAVLTLATTMVPVSDLWLVQEGLVDAVVMTFGSVALFLLVLARVLGLVRSVEQGQQRQQRLQHEARHDPLTGLGNRVLFSERVAAALRDRSSQDTVAVLFIDLDDFKTVNDSLGHQAGDDLLVAVAERLLAGLGSSDLAARLGGDEFAVLLSGRTTRQEAARVAERLLAELQAPMLLHGREVRAAGSIGIAVQAGGQGDVQSLLRGADLAMYLAKSKGKGGYEFFEDCMHDQVVERLELKADLQSAVERGELGLVYQPIVDMTDRIAACEALLRWHHPVRGSVSPDVFIPLAEETGLIVGIGRWVLHEACREAASWQTPSMPIGVNINLSVRQLHDSGLVDDVAAAMASAALDPALVTLEVTETTLMVDTALAAARLRAVKELAVRVAIDDFGTGYSSLTYLQRFPVDTIKIDRSFVRELGREGNAAVLVRSVVDLASALSMTTVAEGVEDRQQLDALDTLQCGLRQGYYFHRPMTAGALAQVLETQRATVDAAAPAASRGAADAAVPGAAVRPGSSQVLHGIGALEQLGAGLDRLQADLRVPVTGRRPWLTAWAASHSEHEPLAVVVRTATGELDGVALLATRHSEGTAWVTALGEGAGGPAVVVARTGASAALADALLSTLRGLGTPWSLRLAQLQAGAPVVDALMTRLEAATLLPELSVPRVRLDAGPHVGAHLSRNTRKTLKRARNRIAADRLALDLRLLARTDDVLQALPEVERVHRERDHAVRGRSDLDTAEQAAFWRTSLRALAEREELELHTLRLDGRLAAYVVAVVDGDSYRVLDGRFATAYAAYSPGRLLEAAALARAAADDRFTELDWVSGVGQEKILTINDAERRCRLVAESEPGAQLALLLSSGLVPAQRAELNGTATAASGEPSDVGSVP